MTARIPSTFRNHQIVKRNSSIHKAWALEVAKQAKQVLQFFEKERPDDNRPRQAIEAIRSWARGQRELGLLEVRTLSLSSHAAARASKTNAAKFAARAAGQAVATWHVPTHATAVPKYVQKAMLANKS